MFWRNSSGMCRWLHSSMKWAPFTDDSLKRTPLLARMPTGCPIQYAVPHTRVLPKSGLNSWKSESSTIRATTSRTS